MRAANFVEETTTSIAGTSGNGAVTLTAITSTPRFSTVFGTGATTVRYVIEDTVGKQFETGIGSVASNVLTRTRPQVTWNGTTYDDSTPSPIAFGSTPTSGDIKVRIAATAENTGGFIMPGGNATVGSQDGFAISANQTQNGNGSAGTMTTGTEYYTCYLNPIPGLLTGVGIDVTTAGGNVKLALYACSPGGLPGEKIVDFNVIPIGTTGVKTDTATGTWSTGGPVWLTPGWYFIGFIASAGGDIRGWLGTSSSHRTPVGRPDGYGYSETYSRSGGSYATGLPANPAPTALVSPGGSPLGNPWVTLRITP